jgi:hypothetical protein
MFLFRLAWGVDKLGVSALPFIFKKMLAKWTPKGFTPVMTFSDARWRNFRRLHWDLYKFNRENKAGPQTFRDCKAFIVGGDPALFRYVQGAEADDLMAVGITENPGDVCVSCDKDMRTVPGWHFNPIKEKVPVYIDPDTAYKNFLVQWVMGDMGDFVPGIYQHGKVAATNIAIKPNPELLILARYAITHDANPRKGNLTWIQYALSQFMCLRMLRTTQELLSHTAPCAFIPRPSGAYSESSAAGAASNTPTSPSSTETTNSTSASILDLPGEIDIDI